MLRIFLHIYVHNKRYQCHFSVSCKFFYADLQLITINVLLFSNYEFFLNLKQIQITINRLMC